MRTHKMYLMYTLQRVQQNELLGAYLSDLYIVVHCYTTGVFAIQESEHMEDNEARPLAFPDFIARCYAFKTRTVRNPPLPKKKCAH